jgi:hypothetical protein
MSVISKSCQLITGYIAFQSTRCVLHSLSCHQHMSFRSYPSALTTRSVRKYGSKVNTIFSSDIVETGCISHMLSTHVGFLNVVMELANGLWLWRKSTKIARCVPFEFGGWCDEGQVMRTKQLQLYQLVLLCPVLWTRLQYSQVPEYH